MLMKETTGLIIVDIQGKLARLVHDSDTLIANCEKLIKAPTFLIFLLFISSKPLINSVLRWMSWVYC